jgi:uncharacterized protein YbbC (DUF1343 family)
LLAALRQTHSAAFAFRPAQFDRLAGGPELRVAIERGQAVSAIAARWREELKRFLDRRRAFLLYPD